MKKTLLIGLFSLLFAHDAPYSLEKFQDVLNKSKLQAPGSSFNPLYSVKYGEFEDYSNRYFYLQDRKYMVFYMCGYKNRSELRFKDIWSVDTNTLKEISARVKLFPLNTKKEFTFLQIHADSTLKNKPIIHKPLLRVVWYKVLKHKKNYLWAIIRTNATLHKTQKDYLKIPLIKAPKGFFDIKISVKNKKLNIYVDNKNVVKDFDVAYWSRYHNYFKAGVYLQSEGCAKVLFDKLQIKTQEERK